MNPQVVAQVQRSFEAVVPLADRVGDVFYSRLFETHPELQIMFPIDIGPQAKKLVQMLALVVKSLDRFEEIAPAVQELGRRHKTYGVSDSHYPVVGETLLWTLAHLLGKAFTPDVDRAWRAAFNDLSAVMIAAAR